MRKTSDFKLGDMVVYKPHHLTKYEQGIVTSINDYYVFVRYGSDTGSKATRPEDIRKV